MPVVSDGLGYDSKNEGQTPRRQERRNRNDGQGKTKRNFGFAGVVKKLASAWIGDRRY